MARHLLPLRQMREELARLERFMRACEIFYPGMSEDLATHGDDQSEFLRNGWSAVAHLQCWVAYRESHGRDPRPSIRQEE